MTPLPWMQAPEAMAVFKALMAGGKEARFIGGCVRDAILKTEVRDIDIATPEPPDRVLELLAAAGIRAIPTGFDHGTITAVIGDKHFEVTSLRVDVESHGRHATVAFTDDWEADARRRDFTINTLSCTPDGDIYDPLEALDDLGKRWVRFVGEPRDRINEDVLRLLRYFRFYATYANPPPNVHALAACRALAPRLKELSGERIHSEMFRILLAPNPADTLLLMKGERVLDYILPEAINFGRLRMISWLESTALNVASIAPDPLRRLAAMLSDDAGIHASVAGRLRLSNMEAHRLANMLGGDIEATPDTGPQQRRRDLQQLGRDDYRDLVLLAWAEESNQDPRRPPIRKQAWQALIGEIDAWTPHIFPIKGRDALDMGMEHGPQVGAALATVEDWWRDGDFQAGRDQCLERLQSVIKSGR